MAQIYSHSRLSAFEQCPLKFKFNYIDRIERDTASVEAFLGSRFHDVMEKLYKEIQFKTPTVEDLKQTFDELWDKNWNDDVLIVKKDRTAADYRAIGHKALESYHKRYHPFTDGRVLGIEKRIVIDLDGTARYQVQGYIDRLMECEDGHYEIHDYKTSAGLPEQSRLDADRQLALYEIGVRSTWPDVKEVDLVWHYVVFDKELRSRRRPEQLDALKRDTITLINTIEAATEYPPTESTLCQWCDYQDICPIFAHEMKTDSLPINEYLKDDGVTLVNKFAALAAKKGTLNAEVANLDEELEKIKEAVIAKDQNWAKTVPEGLKEFVRVEASKKVTLSKRKDREGG